MADSYNLGHFEIAKRDSPKPVYHYEATEQAHLPTEREFRLLQELHHLQVGGFDEGILYWTSDTGEIFGDPRPLAWGFLESDSQALSLGNQCFFRALIRRF